jgi:xanthine dehydrogenase YagR molybdenum-binding subunit
VSADVPAVEVLLVPEEDPHVNPVRVKGLGEIGIRRRARGDRQRGVAGHRAAHRHLAITVEKMLDRAG